MPRITKEVRKEDNNKRTKSTKTEKSVAKADKNPDSKSSVKTKAKSTSKDVKKTTKKGITTASNKKTTSKSSSKKDSSNSVKKSSAVKKTTTFASEYYELPYRYNETLVKLLAQTPNKLFVYWDISDNDREMYISQFGSSFFDRTTPVLLVYNETKNYSFRVVINDFANSWYIPISDDNCKYHIELGRIPKDEQFYIPNNYIAITSSNNIDAPNGHILIDQTPKQLCFRNLKTQEITYKDFTSILISKDSKKVHGFYHKFFDEINFEITYNPSSSFRGF